MPFVGVFHRVGEEVGDYLAYATLVDINNERGVGIFGDEFHRRFTHSLFKRLAKQGEFLGKITFLGIDGHAVGVKFRQYKDVVDYLQQVVAVVVDNLKQFVVC